MGITLFTNNAFSSVSDPDEYSPGFDVTSLRRAEIFTYTGIGKNLMPGEGGPTVVGTPTFITDSPFVQLSNNANVAHLSLGINDAPKQTWFCSLIRIMIPRRELSLVAFRGLLPLPHQGYL